MKKDNSKKDDQPNPIIGTILMIIPLLSLIMLALI